MKKYKVCTVIDSVFIALIIPLLAFMILCNIKFIYNIDCKDEVATDNLILNEKDSEAIYSIIIDEVFYSNTDSYWVSEHSEDSEIDGKLDKVRFIYRIFGYISIALAFGIITFDVILKKRRICTPYLYGVIGSVGVNVIVLLLGLIFKNTLTINALKFIFASNYSSIIGNNILAEILPHNWGLHMFITYIVVMLILCGISLILYVTYMHKKRPHKF